MSCEECFGISMKPHAFIVPFPALGHIIPTLHFSHNLISQGFIVTFVHSKQHRKAVFQRAKDGFNNNLLLAHDFRTAELPDSLPQQHNRPQPSEFKDAVISIERGVRVLLKNGSNQRTPVTCIIADTFLPGIQDIANEFGVPKVDLWTSSAAVFSILLHVPLLISKGYIPLQGKLEPKGSTKISCIPGVPPLHRREVPQELFVEDESDTFFQLLVRPFSRLREAYCIFANTFHELERHTVDALIAQQILFVPIGPLLDPPRLLPSNNVMADRPVEKDKQTTDAECLQWLGNQLPASVLYVSFGTMVVLQAHTIQELALGLEASQQPFLWVIRLDPPAVSVHDVLPEGFCFRTRDRGLVVTWAPQLSVLSHPSVGGFLTHCGWNSVLESVFMGVPMLGMPFSVDQPTNLKFITDEWQIGMALNTQEKDELTRREEIEKAVRALMQGEEGREMRRRATQLRDAARRATTGGGSSSTDLQTFVSEMKRRAKTMKEEMDNEVLA